MDSAAEIDGIAPARDRNGRRSPDSLSAPLRRPNPFCGFPARRKRCPDSSLRRGGKNKTRPFRWLKENLRGDTGGIEPERPQPAASSSLVQPALRAKNDRDRAAPRGFRKASSARKTALPGASRIRG